MRYLVAALLMATALTSGARGDEVKTATWFADHPEARAKVNALCKDNPGQAKHEPNCDNAFQGNVIAATRAAQAQSNNDGCQQPRSYRALTGKIRPTRNTELSGFDNADWRRVRERRSRRWRECGAQQIEASLR